MRFSIMPMIETFPLERAAEAFEKNDVGHGALPVGP